MEYIRNQLVEDEVMDQMTMKEYMDPFTGSKNCKAKQATLAAACKCNVLPNFQYPFRGEVCNVTSRACANHHMKYLMLH